MNRRHSMPVRAVLAFVSVFVVAAVSCPSWAHADTLSDLYGCQYDRTSVFVGEDDSGDSYQSPESEMADEADDGIATYSIPSVSPRDISGEMLYFCTGESGQNYDQGLSWGDGYNAMGFYQFDRGTDLGRFLQAVYNYNPSTYSCLNVIGSKYNWALSDKQAGPTRANGDFTQLGKDLNDAWHACYKANPTEFSQLQNGWAYDNYYVPAANYMRSRGIPIDDRCDSVKSLCWGLSNLFGTGGWRKFVGGWTNGYDWDGNWNSSKNWPGAGLTASMSDEEFVTTLCDYVVNNVSVFYKAQPQYWNGWRNRYKAEKAHYLKIIEENAGVVAKYNPSEFAALHAADLPDGTYRLAPAKRADAAVCASPSSRGTVVCVRSASEWDDSQLWRVSHDGEGFVTLTCVSSGFALDVTGGSAARGASLELWDPNGAAAQRWVAVRSGDSYVLVSAVSGSVGVDESGAVVRGRVADVTGGSTSDGTRLETWDPNGAPAQSFSLVPAQTSSERMDALAGESRSVLADGTYVVRARCSSRMVLDVTGGSRSAGANVETWSPTFGGGQRWVVSHDADGYVTLTNDGSGLALDVSGGAARPGDNVLQWAPSGNRNQKWVAVASGGGVALMSAARPGVALDVTGGSSAAGANVEVWDANGAASQSFDFLDAAPDVPACDRSVADEGAWYVLEPACAPGMAVDVWGASRAPGANAQTWSSNGSLGQAFRLEWHDGYFALVNASSGLRLAVEGSDVVPGANVSQRSGALGDDELFSVSGNGDGTVSLVSKATGLALDVANGSASAGANLDAWTPHGGASQRFRLSRRTSALAEGVYSIASASDPALVVDLSGSSAADGAPVVMWPSASTLNQRWYVAPVAGQDGVYTVESLASARRLSAAGGTVAARAAADGPGQWWRAVVGDGTVALESVSSPGVRLGAASAHAGAAVGLVDSSLAAGSLALRPADASLPAGTYAVRSAADPSVVLDVAGGSLSDGANVQAWADGGTGNQKWRLSPAAGGAFAVTNCQSGRALDVSGSSVAPATNVLQWSSSGGANQRWRAVYRPGGWALVSALDPSLVLTLAGGASQGSNAVVDRDSGSSSQRFTFRATTYIPSDRQEMVWKAQGYYSSTNWLILVDNTNNKVGIFNGSRGNWNLVQFWTCTTGKASTPTVLGEYQVGSRGYSFGHGYTCYYWTQFYNDYLFHSVLYDENTFRIQDGRLGQNLSHGCVRLDINNAKWIYSNIPTRTKVVSYR